jgi:hypothetical protein
MRDFSMPILAAVRRAEVSSSPAWVGGRVDSTGSEMERKEINEFATAGSQSTPGPVFDATLLPPGSERLAQAPSLVGCAKRA